MKWKLIDPITRKRLDGKQFEFNNNNNRLSCGSAFVMEIIELKVNSCVNMCVPWLKSKEIIWRILSLFIWSVVEDHKFVWIHWNSEINDNDAPKQLYHKLNSSQSTRADLHIVHHSLSESLSFSMKKTSVNVNGDGEQEQS